MENVYLEAGLKFTSNNVLKEALFWYGIQQHKDLFYIKNDKTRIHVACRGTTCHWQLTAGPDLEDPTAFQIKSMQPIHKCRRTFQNKQISESWIAKAYLDKLLRDPMLKPSQIKEYLISKYQVEVHPKMISRGKKKALESVENLMKKQYGILDPYVDELIRSNPGTTCALKKIDTEPGKPKKFQRFYVCFDALKKSMLNFCRPIIGVDGCFLKHACGGQLLSAVGRDGNNHMFPVAWAVVESETSDSWEWFLEKVGEDLQVQLGDGWTVLSDRQKGLIHAVNKLWPNIEHRMCARHIFTKWRKKNKGRELEIQFWRCVKATSKSQFQREVLRLKDYSEEAYHDFFEEKPELFCKAFFLTHSKCDVVDNNMAETFNSFILLTRYKPIVTMLDDIRLALMERMRHKRNMAGRFIGGIAPRISESMEEAISDICFWEVKWNGQNNSRAWDLTGIPCTHALKVIVYLDRNPEDYVSKWYKVENYKETYTRLLQPVSGSTYWNHEADGSLAPPDFVKRKPGRRKYGRFRDLQEPRKKSTKYSRVGNPIHCSRCRSTEHKVDKCPQPAPPPKPSEVQVLPTTGKRKGRPKGSKNKVGLTHEEMVAAKIPTPAQHLAQTRKLKGPNNVPGSESTQRRTWLQQVIEASTTSKGWRKANGKSRLGNLGKGGIGVYHGPRGEVVYRGSPVTPGVVMRQGFPGRNNSSPPQQGYNNEAPQS